MKSSLTFVLCFLACQGGGAPGVQGESEAESEAEAEAESESWTEVVLADNVRVIDDEQASAAQMQGDLLIFPLEGNEDLLDIEQGDIVLAGIAAGNTGFLWKVEALEKDEDQITIQTEQAAITEAIVSCDLSDTLDLGSGSRRNGSGGAGDIAMGLNIGGTLLFSDPGLSVNIPRGRILLDTSLEHDLQISRGRLQRFVAIARGQFEVELETEISASGTVGVSRGINLWRSRPRVFTQGPVVEVVIVSVYAGFEIDMRVEGVISAGITGESEIAAGARFENGEWEVIADHGFEFSATDPVFPREITGSVRVFVEPRVDVLFYGVAGPRITVQPYAAFITEDSPPPPSWELVGGLRGSVSVEMSILERTSAVFSAQLFDFDHVLTSGVFDEEGEGEAESEGEYPPASVSDICRIAHICYWDAIWKPCEDRWLDQCYEEGDTDGYLVCMTPCVRNYNIYRGCGAFADCERDCWGGAGCVWPDKKM